MDFVIGGLAGAGATVITNPMDVVKTRLQLQGELRARNEHSAQYRGIFHALYVIAKTDGVLALQKGLAPAMLLGFFMNGVRLGLYHVAEVKGWTQNSNGAMSVYKAVFWSSVSGYLSGLLANPMSVVKTRIQAASHPSIAVGRQHRHATRVLHNLQDGGHPRLPRRYQRDLHTNRHRKRRTTHYLLRRKTDASPPRHLQGFPVRPGVPSQFRQWGSRGDRNMPH